MCGLFNDELGMTHYKNWLSAKSLCPLKWLKLTRYVTVMLVTSLYWWLYDGNWIEMLVAESLCWRLFSLWWWFFLCINSVTNILNLSPTSVTNIDVTLRVGDFKLEVWFVKVVFERSEIRSTYRIRKDTR